MSTISQIMNITVTGGYNGGAVLTVKLDGETVFSCVGDSPYNLQYTPATGQFTTIKGVVNIEPYIANSNSQLQIRLTGAYEETLMVSSKGSNSSYGYDYSYSYTFTETVSGFNIVIQRNNSDKICVTKNLTTIATVYGVLKQETSIIDPIIMIEGDLTNFIECNYLTIETFGRKYFVNNIRSIRNDLIELTCHVDVLSSFENAIKTNSAIIKRQEKVWNLYLNDGSFKIYQNPNVLTKLFPCGFTTQEFVLAIAGS